MQPKGPEPGEIWSVGALEDLEYVGIAFNFEMIKHLVFKDLGDGTYFIINKDEFYSAELIKRKLQ